MSTDPRGTAPARAPRRAALLLCLLSAPGCVRSPGTGGPAAPGAAPPARRSVRIIEPRGTPRSALELHLEARLLSADRCELVIRVRSPRGGDAQVEFSLPEGAAAVEGALDRDCPLEAGRPREERLVASVPAAGHALIGAAVVLDGRRVEAYAEIGERPGAEEAGLRVRASASGEPVLRIGPEDLTR